MHRWNDEWFQKHGDKLYESINYCMSFWRKWGRIGSHGKEKYGTFRDHITLWDGGIHGLIYPGYARIVIPFLYWKIDPIIKRINNFFGIRRLFNWWQSQVYNYAIQRMCKKYPEIVDELVSDLDGYEMVKPSIFGKINGEKIHQKYWTTFSSVQKYPLTLEEAFSKNIDK